jgi:hypothetical protein
MGYEKFPAYVAAGNLGKRIVRGAPKGYLQALSAQLSREDAALVANASTHGTIRPLSAWMVYGPLYEPGMNTSDPYDRDLAGIVSKTRLILGEDICRA